MLHPIIDRSISAEDSSKVDKVVERNMKNKAFISYKDKYNTNLYFDENKKESIYLKKKKMKKSDGLAALFKIRNHENSFVESFVKKEANSMFSMNRASLKKLNLEETVTKVNVQNSNAKNIHSKIEDLRKDKHCSMF